MPAPVLVSSVPANGAVNVDLNAQPLLTWDQALLASTVSPALIVLEDTDLDEPIGLTLEYVAGALAFKVVPDRLLEPNTTYRLLVTGTNTATALGPLKASDGTALTATITIVFTTGTEISTSEREKTPEEEAAEGDLALPDEVTVRPPGEFYVVRTNPENRAWHVPRGLEEIQIEFSGMVNPATVTSDTVEIDIFPFLEDPKHFAVPAYLGADVAEECSRRFEFQGDTDTTGGVLDFDPPTGILSVAYDKVVWRRQVDKSFAYNSTVEVTLGYQLADTGGNQLGVDQRFTFHVDPWPDWVSARRLRRALHPVDLARFGDDVLGLAIWNSAMDVGNMVGWAIQDMCLPPEIIRKLTECKTIADVFYMLLAEKQLAAGERKMLGDMEHEVSYPTSRAADAKPERLRASEECIAELEQKIMRYWTGQPRVAVKGRYSPVERPNYRTRLWRLYEKSITTSSVPVVEDLPAGNTAAERYPDTPGRYDPWA